MTGPLDDRALDRIFRTARTHNAWLDREVPDAVLRALWELMKYGPTSANCMPARLLFVKSPEAKARLAPALSEGNRDKTMAAPVTVIVGYDLEFYERLPELFPHEPDAPNWFKGDPDKIRTNAFRNGTLQGAYMIVAARALGLDCGPMSGFSNAKVDAEFFPDGRIKSNFLCNLGYGDPAALPERNPRLGFDDACSIL